jgi:hypothetical protein
MDQIAVLQRQDHTLANETKECLAYLHRADIPAHIGKEERVHGVVWVDQDGDIDRAVFLLRTNGFEVMRFSRVPI